jgi:hypothetical protein
MSTELVLVSELNLHLGSIPGSPTNSLPGARRARTPEYLSWAIADELPISPLIEARLILNPFTGTWLPPDLVVLLLLITEIER